MVVQTYDTTHRLPSAKNDMIESDIKAFYIYAK
jgi:hypothetical protein